MKWFSNSKRFVLSGFVTAVQNPLKSATGGLYIGAGRNLDAGTLFSGLIDDIRIYNRVVSP